MFEICWTQTLTWLELELQQIIRGEGTCFPNPDGKLLHLRQLWSSSHLVNVLLFLAAKATSMLFGYECMKCRERTVWQRRNAPIIDKDQEYQYLRNSVQKSLAVRQFSSYKCWHLACRLLNPLILITCFPGELKSGGHVPITYQMLTLTIWVYRVKILSESDKRWWETSGKMFLAYDHISWHFYSHLLSQLLKKSTVL